MWLWSGSSLLWLFYNSIRVFYLGSKLSATESSSVMLGALGPSGIAIASFPKPKIQSVSFGQLFGESAVVGSHRALSGHSRQGQSTMVSIDVGSLFG
jgi:hypothetical protein